MRVVVCWADIAGYTAACWRVLASRRDIDLFVIASVAGANAPFASSTMDGIPCRLLTPAERADTELVARTVVAQNPDVVVVCGWFIPAYTKLVFDRRLANAKFVMGIDTTFQNTWRQWLGRYRLRRFFRRIDRVMVAGERSFMLARYLGFSEDQIRRGNYGIDFDLFGQVYRLRQTSPNGWPTKFLFTGRYVPEKGISVMLEAYQAYCRQVSDPWPLTCCGKGPLDKLIAQASNVTDAGFKQPSVLRDVYREHSVLILPSVFEPWGQVIVEAAAAGMSVIATESCGASVEMIRSYYNGMTVPTGDPQALAKAMRWIHQSAGQLPEMGHRSHILAGGYSADRWADRWQAVLEEACGNR